jgi:hypothetical protein
MKPGCDLLVCGRVGEHIACELFYGELIERHVGVERAYHPVTILPHHAALVFFISIGVGVARKIEPGPRPSLAVVRRGEQSLDPFFVSVH